GKVNVQVDLSENAVPLPQPIASTTFLRMSQPLDDPSERAEGLDAGVEYCLSFEFVVPCALPLQACQHSCRHGQVHEEHLSLPPSLGTLGLRKKSLHGKDDMAPETASVIYHISLRISKKSFKAGTTAPIVEWEHPINIRPLRVERAPVLVPRESKFYCLRREVAITRGFSRALQGVLSAQAVQPTAIAPGKTPFRMVPIDLHYRALSGAPPPKLSAIKVELQAITLFGAKPWSDFPDLTNPVTWGRHQNHYIYPVSLADMQPGPLKWQPKSTDDETSPSFRSTIQVPVELPGDFDYPPTFSHCFISRVYALRVDICYRAPGAWGRSRVSMTVPLQIL
ncbi:arrestin domain-containing protein, partial [Aspergillus fijiensis CBS 313.89]